MEKVLIYDNGDIKLENFTPICFRNKDYEESIIGMVIGVTVNQFIVTRTDVKTMRDITLLVSTEDIEMVQIYDDGEEHFISLEEYKNREIYQWSQPHPPDTNGDSILTCERSFVSH